MNINIKLIEDGILPTKGSEHAAAFDVYVRNSSIEYLNEKFAIVTYYLGFASEIPEGYHAKLFPRSSVHFSHSLKNCVGIIDSDYRGEWMMKYKTDVDFDFFYKIGERCGQFTIEENKPITLTVVNELTETNRGEGGFGSTGV